MAHPFPTHDNASEKCNQRNKCQTPICFHPRQYNDTTNDNKNVTAFVDQFWEWKPPGTVTPVQKITEVASLIISFSISKVFDKKIAVRVINLMESPCTINKNTQIADFSVVPHEKSKFIKPRRHGNSQYDSGRWSASDYLFDWATENEWISGNIEDRTPIQTRILNELREVQQKEKLNPKDNADSRMKFLKRVDWIDTLLTETEKQAVEDILVEYHDIFARHRMDCGMNTDFNVKLTPNDGKAAYNQNLPMPIHLKEDSFVELALMHQYGIITVLPFSKHASPIFAQRKPNGKLPLPVDLKKINTLIADD